MFPDDADFMPLSSSPTRDSQAPSSCGSSDPPPWCRRGDLQRYRHPDFTASLHEELLDFVRYLDPGEEDRIARAELLRRVSEVCQGVFQGCEVQLFGSFQNNLFLSTSDLDVMVDLRRNSTRKDLYALADAFQNGGMVKYIEVVESARVPLVKFIDKETEIPVDICFNSDNAIHAHVFYKALMSEFPPLRILIMVLKQFLYCRQLNETYSGGVGSFLLLTMLVGYLQSYPKQFRNFRSYEEFFSRTNLGILLLGFLQTYSRDFNYVVSSLTIDETDRVNFEKKDFSLRDRQNKPHLFSVSNPMIPGSNLGTNSYNVMKVRAAFSWAFNELTYEDSKTDSPTLLGRIIPYNKHGFIQRNFIEETQYSRSRSSSDNQSRKRKKYRK